LRRVEARARRAGPEEWILGHGWNQNDWAGFGTAADLDRVCAGRPAYLTAKSLHAGWANREALRRAGISNATPDPPGGRIQRNSKGSPTGILLESAMSLVADAIPATPMESVVESIRAAQERLWRSGLTGIHDFDGPVSFQALQILLERGQLDLRVLKSIPHDRLGETAAHGLRSGFGNSRLWVGHVKLFADGALGPRTAAMLAPYDGEPDNTGYLMLDREAVLERGMRAAEAGLGLAIHAIGDRANHEVLEGLTALRRYESEHGLPRRRHRIEHVQLLHPDDVPRLAALGVVASMQPVHATSDMTMADRYWGRRSAYGYAWHSQMQAGATLAFGSDAPVESPDPFLGLHAAVTRRRRDGTPSTEGWIPAERLSIREALSAYTEGPAFAAGRETKLGRLDSGSYADLVVLDRDPFRIPVDDLLEIKVLATMVGGRWVLREF
jgi:predicted amidohydrolase YtcJ